MQWSSLVVLLLFAPMFFLEAYRINSRYFTIIVAIAVLYPLGKVLQLWLIGPGWIRWYMADVGWVSCIGIVIAFGNILPIRGTMPDRLKAGIVAAFIVAVCIESAQLYFPKNTTKSAFMAAGDWTDMEIFFLMFAINLHLLFKMKQQVAVPVIIPKKSSKKSRRKKRR